MLPLPPGCPSVDVSLHLAGGFAKIPGAPPDLLHSFYSLSWLSLAGESGVQESMDAALGITKRADGKLRRHRASLHGC